MFATFQRYVMKAFFMVIFSLVVAGAYAQEEDTWKLLINKKVVASGKPGNDEAVVRLQTAAVAKMTGANFTVQYAQLTGGTGWNRTIECTDAADKSLHTVQMPAASGSAAFPMTLLKKYAASKTPLFIYTTSLPKDKKKAAVVRVRRFLLCKIEWL